MTSEVSSAAKWETDYQRKTDGWDLGGPTPAFRRLASGNRFPPGRMLVPGAGRGHAAGEFARHGFKVTAVDFTSYAVSEIRRLAQAELPFAVSEAEIRDLFLERGFQLAGRELPHDSVSPGRGADELCIFRKTD